MDRIEISLPNHKIFLELIQQTDENKIKWCTLGKLMFQKGQSELQCINNTEFQQNLNNIKQRHDEKIKSLENNIVNEKQTKEKLIKNHENSLLSLQQQITQQTKILYQEKIDELNYKLQEKEKIINNKNIKIDTITKTLYQDMQKQISNKDNFWLDRLETKEKYYEGKLEEYRKKMEKQLLREENSTLIGQDGEALCEQQLNLFCPSAHVSVTTGVAHRGDFIVSMKGINIMIENKRYTKNVPKPERIKFYEDMKLNADFHGGILCSQKSGICAKEDYSLEIIEGKPVMMLFYTAKSPVKIKIAIELLTSYIKNETIQFDNKEKLDCLKGFSKDLKKNLNKLRRLLKKHETEMTACFIDEEKITNQIFNTLKIKR
jgi:hypothetical protein